MRKAGMIHPNDESPSWGQAWRASGQFSRTVLWEHQHLYPELPLDNGLFDAEGQPVQDPLRSIHVNVVLCQNTPESCPHQRCQPLIALVH